MYIVGVCVFVPGHFEVPQHFLAYTFYWRKKPELCDSFHIFYFLSFLALIEFGLARLIVHSKRMTKTTTTTLRMLSNPLPNDTTEILFSI